MQGVARQAQSGGQRKIKISILHEPGERVVRSVDMISSQLQEFLRIAERWTIAQRWTFLLTRLLQRWLGGKWLPVSLPMQHHCYQERTPPGIPPTPRPRGQIHSRGSTHFPV